ncbi:MAG TPA: pyrroloquinoline quinone-dependent dehydrogenase [Candidatus Acidoferrales bacterium]|nr:pyrroloquinoline quinone-dependent dehydrogenase [Candidatus Acidoferrales bacterium]
MKAQTTRRQFMGTAAGMLPLAIRAAAPAPVGWTVYGGDQAATHYSPLNQINRENVGRLRPAWVHNAPPEAARYRGSVECTPLVVDGVMYIVGAALIVQALDAATGKLLWTHAPLNNGPQRRGAGTSRGVTYWKDGDRERIFAPVQNHILCLNAKSGKIVETFGDNGVIDLEKDVDRDLTHGESIVATTPGGIYQDLLIVSTRDEEGPRPAAPGHIRAYDVRTGKRRWIFHTIPHPGEFGHDTWSPDSWKSTGGANCWGGLSIDEARGLVFVSTGSATFDFYGGDRVGANLFANSVIALKAGTGERVWHFQTVHHDLWDYDIPCQPALITITHEGKKVDVVAQVSKTGWVYLFERATGKPLYPIEERAVPQSDLPGEKTYPTQPFPTNPPPFARQGISREDLTNISPEAHAWVTEQLKDFRFGPMFTPPGKQETIVLPGYHGGALWGGASFDPDTEWLYVNHNEIPWSTSLSDAPKEAGFRYNFSGYKRNVDQDGYPVIRPPWGRISAIDLRNCKIVWQVAHGEYAELTARGIPRTGTYIRGGNIATKGGLLFSAGTLDNKFRAYDSKTGKILWETSVGGGAFATPSTYMVNGKQFVVVPVSISQDSAETSPAGPYKPGDFVAFALTS